MKGCPAGGKPLGCRRLKVLLIQGWVGGSGWSGPAALALAASSVVNIRPVFGSMVPIWAVTASVITAVLIWSVRCSIRGVMGLGLGGNDACTTNKLALDSVLLGGLGGCDGVVSVICGASRGAAAAVKSLSKMSSPNSVGAGLTACQYPSPGPLCSQTISTQHKRAELNSTGVHGFSTPSVITVDLA